MKFIIFFIFLINDISARENLQRCQQATTINYGYDTFYEITQGAKHSNGTLRLDFKVKAKSDAHVLLSTTTDITLAAAPQAYEIVIGGGKNTFTQIRMLKKGAKATETIPDLLSEHDFRGFWISINHTENMIAVGKENEKDPFLFWKNPQIVPIRYFAFGTWVNVKADWIFGCPDQDDPEFVQVEKNYTALQRLEKDLLDLYDPVTIPNEASHLLVVKTSFLLHNVYLDEKTSRISIDGVANMKWNDEKLRWKPEEYDGISILYLTPYHIWTPNLRVLSGIQYQDTLEYLRNGLTVLYNGDVFWKPEVHFITYCEMNTRNWPHDVQNCSIDVGFWAEQGNLVIDLSYDQHMISKDKTNSEWEILDVRPYNYVPEKEANYEMNLTAFGVINISLKRCDQSYSTILFCPFFSAALMTLASFWIDPDHSGQLFLSCGNLIILTIMLIDLGEIIPVHQDEIPNIILLYSLGIIFSCLPILLYVFLKNISQAAHLPEHLSAILNNNLAKTLCLLPGSLQDQTIYSNLNENQQEKYNEDRINMLRLAVAIERIFFIWYLILFSLLMIFYQ